RWVGRGGRGAGGHTVERHSLRRLRRLHRREPPVTGELPASIGDSYETLTTKEGWRTFVDERPEPPAPLEPDAKLDPEELDSYQEARKDYHSSSVIVATPTIRKVVTTGRKDRKSTRLNSSHVKISYAVFCLKK